MKTVLITICVIIMASGIFAQNLDDDFYKDVENFRRTDLPIVTFRSDNQFLMRAFYPEYYESEKQIRRDIRWVTRNDSVIVDMWDIYGDTILALIENHSGIKWEEKEIDIRLMKYFRRVMMYDPPVLPLEGVMMEDYTEAVPYGYHQLLNIIKLLAGRNLLQMDMTDNTFAYLADHPLLDRTAYRFDVLALTLAAACAEYIIPEDSLEAVLDTRHWRRHNPGHEVFANHFRYNWPLKPERPLITYLADEPSNSALVALTRPPTKVLAQNGITDEPDGFRLEAGGGRFGFSVVKTARGYLEVVDLDSIKLAYNSGLMVGDKIKRVNGKYARNARELMGKLIDKIDTEGIYLIVIRNEEEIGVLLLPTEEEYIPEDYLLEDY